MDDFIEKMKKYTQDNEHMRMCVRKFDEDLSLKANKASIFNLRDELEKKFVPRQNWKDIESELQNKENARQL